MARVAALAVAVGMLAVSGCEGDPHRASWTVRFGDPTLRERADVVEARIERGGCGSGIEVYREDIGLDGAARMPASLAPGVYGFAARARDAACTYYAAGCTERTLPTEETSIVTVLTASAEQACASDAGSGTDGGGDVDGGTEPDAGAGDAGSPDGGPPDTGPPPPVDAGPDLTSGLVAWWTCDDDLGDNRLDDASGNGNDGACTDSVCPDLIVLGGPSGTSCEFGAPRVVRVPDHPGFRAASFTLSLWIHARDVSGAVIGKPVGSGASNSWQIELQAPHAVFTTGVTPDSRLFLVASVPLPSREWHHLAATYDGTTKRLYQDGTLVGMEAAPIEFDDGDVIIGADENDGSIVLHAPVSLDEIRFYERALDEDAIAALAAR